MKKLLIIPIYLSLFFFTACNTEKSEEKAKYGEKTLELIEIVENNPNIKSMLVASIEKAKEINPDRTTNPAQNLEEYYEFITWAEKAMPWSFLENKEFSKLYDKIDQSLSYFYFFNDQPLSELEGKGYYKNSLQYIEPYSSWLVSFNKSWGNYLDTDESWNYDYHQMALQDDIFGLNTDWYEDPSNWKSFNQFFARYLKSPDKRPIVAITDNSIVASPADAVPQGMWAIDSNSYIVQPEGVAIKSGTPRSIKKLIGEESGYENEFSNGTFTHTFLDLGDYHRYHFPVSGIVKEVRIIPGENAAGGSITWDATNKRYAFGVAPLGWQFVETRGCVILETKEFGLVALLPIGMSQVCSVNFEENIKVGTKVSKGDMLGYFLFGGSDFIMIFQNKAGFVLDAPKTEGNRQSYKHLLMGERIGYLQEVNNEKSNE